MAERSRDQEGGNEVNPIQIQKYLGGVDYPAKKQELLERAKSNDAPEDVIGMLEQLPEREYEKPTDVTKAIGDGR